MLTGDLGHTAKEIGFNCGILSRDKKKSTILNLQANDKESVQKEILSLKNDLIQSRREGKETSLLISG